MSDLQDQYHELLALYRGQFKSIIDLQSRNVALIDLLRELVTPPLAYAKKRDAVERARVLLEGWEEL